MQANYLPKTSEQLHLEHQKRRAAIWTRYPKIKRAFDARIAWRQSPAGIEFCASRMAKLLATEAGKPVSEMLPVARQRIRAGFAKLKPSSPDRLPAGFNTGSPSARVAALPLSPGSATRPAPAATPVVAARPAVAAKPMVAPQPIDQRAFSELATRWQNWLHGQTYGGSRFMARFKEMTTFIKSNGRAKAAERMRQDLASR